MADNANIEDLQKKMNVLKNALLKERQKTQGLEKKQKELEESITSKDVELANLNKEKRELESQLVVEKKKNEISSEAELNKLKTLAKGSEEQEKKIKELSEENKKYKTENEELSTKLADVQQQYDTYKSQYMNLIKVQTEKIKKMEDDNNIIIKENEELKQKHKEIMKENEELRKMEEHRKYVNQDEEEERQRLEEERKKEEEAKRIKEQMEKEKREYEMALERKHFNEILTNLRTEKDEAVTKMKSVFKKMEELTLKTDTYKEMVHNHEEANEKLANKLAQYKNMLIDIHLRTMIFHGFIIYKLKTNKEIDITFKIFDMKVKKYVMMITGEDYKLLLEIMDVEYCKPFDKNKIEIGYMSNGKKSKMNVAISELVVDLFMDTYNAYYTKCLRGQGKVDL